MKVVILLLKAVKRIPASPEKPSIMAQLTFSSPQVDFRRRQLVFRDLSNKRAYFQLFFVLLYCYYI